MNRFKKVIFDLDGVFTNGKFLYDSNGKKYKEFGADDAYGLKMLAKWIGKDNIHIISADKRGFKIGEKRISDIGFKLDLVPGGYDRFDYIYKKFAINEVIYVGDSFSDISVLRNGIFTICPNNSSLFLKKEADIVLESDGGERAVLEACLKIIGIIKEEDIKEIINTEFL